MAKTPSSTLLGMQERLKAWFLAEKRPLPWRESPSPYAVWVSEVMLQQTQVAVVIPYFERWMRRFPTIEALSKAPLDAVIKMWEGLGYYSRARNLHEGARYVLEHFGGKLPATEKQLASIKGLGPYTIGAILSFAFHQKVPAVDGNVLRVLSRLFKIGEDIAKPKTVAFIREKAAALLPEKEPWIFNEALIELGATICKKSPNCSLCPLKRDCRAHLHGVAEALPLKSRKVGVTQLHRQVAIICADEHFLVQRKPKGEVMSDLHEFFYFEALCETPKKEHFINPIQSQLGINVAFDKFLPKEQHGFTRYRVTLSPALLTCSDQPPIKGYQWVAREELNRLAFSSGHRRILQALI